MLFLYTMLFVFCRGAVKSATDLGAVSEPVVEPRLSPAAHNAVVEGTATTDDLATASVPDMATQEVALEDGTDLLAAQDVEKADPSSAAAEDGGALLVKSPATDSQQTLALRTEVASSSSLSRAELLSEAIIASNDKQAAELRKALSDLSAAYKVLLSHLYLAPKDQVFFFDFKRET